MGLSYSHFRLSEHVATYRTRSFRGLMAILSGGGSGSLKIDAVRKDKSGMKRSCGIGDERSE